MAELFVGLMSGTSMDGIDAALVSLDDSSCDLQATCSRDYPSELRDRLRRAINAPNECTVDDIGMLDHWVGECFRDAANALLQKAGVAASAVRAIGSHGQTIRHRPRIDTPFTLQIGDPHVIAAGTGIMTVADFRRRDMALGGEGAPLAPAFHEWLFRRLDYNRVILNIGGIANLTLLPADTSPVTGFDSGPGNTLMDAWIWEQQGSSYDSNGKLAASGATAVALLEELLNDPYFSANAPKSTGLEYFNLHWLQSFLKNRPTPTSADIQSTLCSLTVNSIATAIRTYGGENPEVFVCGGGAHNTELMRRLRNELANEATIAKTSDIGLDVDWVEACAFAWLAKRCIEGKPGNLPSVTGASHAAIMGSIFP